MPPVVSVVTPVYNGERHLAECIESVLSQSFHDFEYLIVDNCSSDNTRDIAARYARDPRVRIYHYQDFVPVIASYNRAARLASSQSRYMQFVAADDLLLPDCLKRMVGLAEAHPHVRLVASYKIHGRQLVCDGPEYPREVLSGKEVCQRFFRGELGLLGGPTNHLIKRSSLHGDQKIFDPEFLAADTELFIRLLKNDADYAFVHQVLTFTREHDSTVSASARAIGMGSAELLAILLRHGQEFLPHGELLAVTRSYRMVYTRWLIRAWLKIWDRRGWRYQFAQRRRFNIQIRLAHIVEAAAWEALATAASPLDALRAVRRSYRRSTDTGPADSRRRFRLKTNGPL